MTRYLLGNLESRQIQPDNDLRLERAEISHTVRVYPIILNVTSVVYEQKRTLHRM